MFELIFAGLVWGLFVLLGLNYGNFHHTDDREYFLEQESRLFAKQPLDHSIGFNWQICPTDKLLDLDRLYAGEPLGKGIHEELMRRLKQESVRNISELQEKNQALPTLEQLLKEIDVVQSKLFDIRYIIDAMQKSR